MDAIIRLHLSELSDKSIIKIKDILSRMSGAKDPELIISLVGADSKKTSYFSELDCSIEQMANGETVSFSMEELEKYLQELE